MGALTLIEKIHYVNVQIPESVVILAHHNKSPILESPEGETLGHSR